MAETQTEMTEDKPVQKVMSGFAKRNANKERIEQEERELQELMAADTREENVDRDNNTSHESEPESAEERTFKKRYGDLRRHAQKKEQEFQKQIDELKTQLEASTKKEIQYPKSEDELSAWMEKYPDVAKIVETIAMKKAKEQASEFESKFKQIDEMKAEALREKAEAELLKLHPDFVDIRNDDGFHDWAEEQPQYIQDVIYNNSLDAKAISRVLDLYKNDMGNSKSKTKNSLGAAKAVNTRSSRSNPDVMDKSGSIRESDVMKMTAQEYEKHQEKITEAIRTNKFIYDVSGSAR